MKKKVFNCSIAVILLTLLDQLTKLWAIKYLKDADGIDIIKDVLRLQYLENHGAAFSLFQNKISVFIPVTIVFILVFIFLIGRTYYSEKYLPLRIVLIFIIAGALGNLIDRIAYKYVVDFIYFSLIDFPIFNVADIYVTCSCAALIILMFFVYKEDDFEDIKNHKNCNKK